MGPMLEGNLIIGGRKRIKGMLPTGEELKKRLIEIAKLINKPSANVEFVETAFALLDDCNLITDENCKILTSSAACSQINRDLRFMRNPNEGALRRAIDYNYSTLGEDGEPRFYPPGKRRVRVNGEDYLISNDWYKDNSPKKRKNKAAFFEWICRAVGVYNPYADKEIKDEIDRYLKENKAVYYFQ